jgi:hypothetical protein
MGIRVEAVRQMKPFVDDVIVEPARHRVPTGGEQDSSSRSSPSCRPCTNHRCRPSRSTTRMSLQSAANRPPISRPRTRCAWRQQDVRCPTDASGGRPQSLIDCCSVNGGSNYIRRSARTRRNSSDSALCAGEVGPRENADAIGVTLGDTLGIGGSSCFGRRLGAYDEGRSKNGDECQFRKKM